ncbi:MAG: hypothetical protein KBF96_09580 [Ignavibacteria bacterium]|jgi:hypothetical protein|nr:hypothetical protein [Ignavibacteria bacterium]
MNGCGSSAETTEDSEDESLEEGTDNTGYKEKTSSTTGSDIIYHAGSEQANEMYSSLKDTSYLYWLDDQLLITYGSTKCNIFALNVLHRSGYKTPDVNTLCADLFDTAFAADILPVIGINTIEDAETGDLIIWSYHVIIFETALNIHGQEYAYGWWAGTRQEDNGDNILNNVCHGKYPLNGEYVVRRPVKK